MLACVWIVWPVKRPTEHCVSLVLMALSQMQPTILAFHVESAKFPTGLNVLRVETVHSRTLLLPHVCLVKLVKFLMVHPVSRVEMGRSQIPSPVNAFRVNRENPPTVPLAWSVRSEQNQAATKERVSLVLDSRYPMELAATVVQIARNQM